MTLFRVAFCLPEKDFPHPSFSGESSLANSTVDAFRT